VRVFASPILLGLDLSIASSSLVPSLDDRDVRGASYSRTRERSHFIIKHPFHLTLGFTSSHVSLRILKTTRLFDGSASGASSEKNATAALSLITSIAIGNVLKTSARIMKRIKCHWTYCNDFYDTNERQFQFALEKKSTLTSFCGTLVWNVPT
jgi:hypothetical protein